MPADLPALWRRAGQAAGAGGCRVTSFYGHRAHARLGCFSNFFNSRFAFTLPPECDLSALEASGRPRTVEVRWAEQAIMLSKAAVLGDYASFDKILAADNPRRAKALGRSVAPWDQARWDGAVCAIALAVVTQKFQSDPRLGAVLLRTGTCVLAEMTSRDCCWGTGVDIGGADEHRPERWPGTNILGWALMRARDGLRGVAL